MHALFPDLISDSPSCFPQARTAVETCLSLPKFGFKEQSTSMSFFLPDARRSCETRRVARGSHRGAHHLEQKSVARSAVADIDTPLPEDSFSGFIRGNIYLRSKIPISLPVIAVQSGHNHHQALPVTLPLGLFSQKQGASKIHVLLHHDGYIRAFAAITDSKTHESLIV